MEGFPSPGVVGGGQHTHNKDRCRGAVNGVVEVKHGDAVIVVKG